uniref:Extended synaptotagmin 1 n=1 Tax=Equus asinus asinus TaxID=83772 RepID=A0A8C4LBZ6_EQUAS
MERSPGDDSSPSPSPVEQPSAPSDPPDQPPTAHTKPNPSSGNQPAAPSAAGEALAVLSSFGRRLLVLVPVYLAGAIGLSVGFVLFGLALYLGWRRVRDKKERSLRVARQLLDDEEQLTAKTLYMSHRELPAWVSFPDVEKAEWLNKIVAQVWPFLGQYMEKLLAETVAPAVRGSNTHLQTFTFTRVELGEKPLRILGVKVHTGQSKQQILLDLNISYVGDVQIDVEVKKYFCKAGVKGMQLHGVLRVILEPLIGDLPIVGAVSMFFIRRPTLDINWTGMTNLLDIPGLSSLSDTMIMDSIAAFLVLPNRLLVPLVPDLQDVAQLRSPLPRGIIRIHLLAARRLSSKDKYVKGLIEGKSDPYALVRVGTQTFCSRVINEELNPQWGETYEVIVHEVPGQEIEVEVFDKDPDKDDFLGGQGQVHLRLEWLSLLPDAEKLEEVTNMGNRKLALYSTNCPVWEEAFRFFLQDPRSQELDVQVKDDSRALTLGALTLPLARLLTAPELTLDQWFQLSSSGPNTRLYMKLVMRILYLDSSELRFPAMPDSPGPWDLDNENPQIGSSVDIPPRPCHTTPDSHFGTEVSLYPERTRVRSPTPRCINSYRLPRHSLLPDLSPSLHSPVEAPAGPLGQVKLTVWYYSEERKLVSIVHSCRALRQNGRDPPDPYVSLLLLPDKNRGTKRKTSQKKRTLNPEFNERSVSGHSGGETALRRKLDISVKSNSSFMSRERELLGKVRGQGWAGQR